MTETTAPPTRATPVPAAPAESAPKAASPAASGDTAPASGATAARPRTAAFLPPGVAWIVVPLILVSLAGIPYYRLPIAERLWHPWHEWLHPSGALGQGCGFLALGMFLFLWLYPLRKRWRALSSLGRTSRWLDVHIVAGIAVPLVGAVHASWRFNGLIGLGYLAMVIVAASGAVGRYLYVRIPRARDGLALSREEIAGERRAALGDIVDATGFTSAHVVALLKPTPVPDSRNLLRFLGQMLADDFARRRAVRLLLREWRDAAVQNPPTAAELRRVTRLARREMAVSQQVRMLDATNAVFRLWHLAHLPFAITAFAAVVIHVAVVVFVGSTWIG